MATLDFDYMLDDMFSKHQQQTDGLLVSQYEEEVVTTVVDEKEPTCPRCNVLLEYAETEQENGDIWTFLKCPKEESNVRCFVSCGTKEECHFNLYMHKVENELHPVYKQEGSKNEIPFTNLECWCCESLLLCMSRSEKNPETYFKCRSNGCGFFQWADQAPRGKQWKWFTMRLHPEQPAPEQRRKPADLRRPDQFKPQDNTPAIDTSEADERLRKYVAKMKSKMEEVVKYTRGRKPYEAYKNSAKFVAEGI